MRERLWKIGDRVVDVSRRGLIMGVLNVTPDSFSDGGKFFALDKAVERGLQIAAEGADILDIGGESTRPGAEAVAVEEQLRRVLPVIQKLRPQLAIPISIDTSNAEVARAAIGSGALMVNDVTGGRGDKEMLPLIGELRSSLVIMHMQGTPRTMQIAPEYADVVSEISDFFRQQFARAIGCNIDPMAIAFDPGIGFGKTVDHSVQLLAHVEQLRSHNRPIVLGISRKSFLGKLIGSSDIDERVTPALLLTALLRARGADVFRVHDVKESVSALRVTDAILRRAG